MEKKNVLCEKEETAKLLEEYNSQVASEDKHTYSEVYHSDYSDSSCCC